MPLLTYAQARPYARAIKTATQSKKMPPWFADSSVQHYANDMSLPAADITTLAAWADAGAPEGDPEGCSARRDTFVDGWNIGTPDKVVQMPEPYSVPAAGPSSTPTSFSRRASPRTRGCRRSKSARATVR